MQPLAPLLLLASLPLGAQWLDYPDPQIPRNADGTPNLTAPAPVRDGQPDLTGLWRMERASAEEWNAAQGAGFTEFQLDLYDVSKYVASVFWGTPPGEEPLTEAGARVFQEHLKVPNVQERCLPSSIPMDLFTFVFKILQTPREVLTLSEWDDPPRQIFTDGRSLPQDPLPAWMGYSVGSWEGDTFMVQTSGFTDRAWLDLIGHPRSESMRITERYHRRDFGHMDVEMIFDDPVYYTRTFTIKTTANLVPDSDLLEFVCDENEKDLSHLNK